MNKPSEPLGLRSPDGREAQLLSVQVHGEVLGLMWRLTVRQTWRNTSGAPMATRLAFTLAPDQCLLNLQAERNSGVQAIGHINRQSRGICSAGFGVMNTGEQITVQWRIGQLLHLQGGSLRLQVPAAVVPPALRPAKLSFEVHDPAARGTPGSASHEMQKVRHANGMTFLMVAPHGLQKDWGLALHGLRDSGFALASPDRSHPGHGTLLVSRCLAPGHLPLSSQSQPLRLKLLVDQSGAMGAERQSHIQMALERLLTDLQVQDQLSCSRVGQHLVHDLPRLQPCSDAYIKRARALIRHIDLDPGPTDWASTLQALINIRDEDEEPAEDACILLVTAQPLTSGLNMVQALRSAGHRLHVMTVGAAASESDWSVLAQASGGSCETLGPGQHSQPTLQRLFDRMRNLRPVHAQLSLEGAPLAGAQQEHPHMAAGDTLHLWAPFEYPSTAADLAGCPQWQARLQWNNADPAAATGADFGLPVAWDSEGDLTRLCAARQVQLMQKDQAREALMAQHQLVMPDEHRMAISAARAADSSSSLATSSPEKNAVQPPASAVTPMPKRPSTRARPASANPMVTLVQAFNQQAAGYQQFRAALSATLQQTPALMVDGLVMQLARKAGNPGRVWALLLYFLHAEHELLLQGHALQLVEQELASMPLVLRSELNSTLAAAPLVVQQTTRRAA